MNTNETKLIRVRMDMYDFLTDLREQEGLGTYDQVIAFLQELYHNHMIADSQAKERIYTLEKQVAQNQKLLIAQRATENDLAVFSKSFDGFLGMMELLVDELRTHVVPDDKKKTFVNPFSFGEDECRNVYKYLAPTLRNVATDLRQQELEAKQMDAAYRKGKRDTAGAVDAGKE